MPGLATKIRAKQRCMSEDQCQACVRGTGQLRASRLAGASTLSLLAILLMAACNDVVSPKSSSIAKVTYGRLGGFPTAPIEPGDRVSAAERNAAERIAAALARALGEPGLRQELKGSSPN